MMVGGTDRRERVVEKGERGETLTMVLVRKGGVATPGERGSMAGGERGSMAGTETEE